MKGWIRCGFKLIRTSVKVSNLRFVIAHLSVGERPVPGAAKAPPRPRGPLPPRPNSVLDTSCAITGCRRWHFEPKESQRRLLPQRKRKLRAIRPDHAKHARTHARAHVRTYVRHKRARTCVNGALSPQLIFVPPTRGSYNTFERGDYPLRAHTRTHARN